LSAAGPLVKIPIAERLFALVTIPSPMDYLRVSYEIHFGFQRLLAELSVAPRIEF